MSEPGPRAPGAPLEAGLSPVAAAPVGGSRAEARARERVRREAGELLADARALARRRARRLSELQRGALASAMADLEAARGPGDLAALRQASAALEALLAAHPGFARRSPGIDYALSVAKALGLALALRLFVIEAYQIPSGSMIPSLQVGDHIFVNKLAYGLRVPVLHWLPLHWGSYRRGEVVVFAHPLDDALPLLERRDYIKRIVGLPGETIEVRGEGVLVDGVAQPRRLERERYHYFDRQGDAGPWFATSAQLWEERLDGPGGGADHPVLRDAERAHLPYEGPFRVPQGHLFMMGDNRDNSQDGRSGGWYVPFDHVKGRALFVWWSWGERGVGPDEGVGVRTERLFRAVR